MLSIFLSEAVYKLAVKLKEVLLLNFFIQADINKLKSIHEPLVKTVEITDLFALEVKVFFLIVKTVQTSGWNHLHENTESLSSNTQ